jgi:hypothetical protein
MGNKQPGIHKNVYLLVISFLTVLTFIILFASRYLDDNRLTSWQWVFLDGESAHIFIILIAGIIISVFFSKLSLPLKLPVLFLFFTSFASAGIFWREPEVIVDASRYFIQAKHLEVYGIGYFFSEWGRNIHAWTDLPLMPFLYGLIFKWIGESRVYIQIFTTFLFSMTVVITYFIGKELWDEDIGFFGGALLLGIPYLLTQVPLMLVDVPAMFFLTLSIFVFLKAIAKGGITILLSSVVLSLAFFAKYSTWLMLSVLAVVILAYRPHTLNIRPRTYFYRGTLIAVFACLLIGIVFLYKFDVFSEQFKLLMSYQKPGLRRWSESFISTFFFQIHPFITVAALFSIYTAIRKKDFHYMIIFWLVLLVVVLQIKRIRYIIMVFPMLSLMASYGLQEIRNRESRKFLVSCIVITSLVIAVFAYLPFMQKISFVNLKDAGKYLDLLEVSVPILDLHTKKRIHYKYDAGYQLPAEEIEKSSLRFTWEFKNPDYYVRNKSTPENTAIVVISNDKNRELPEFLKEIINGYQKYSVFNSDEGVFQLKTSVRIYHQKFNEIQ